MWFFCLASIPLFFSIFFFFVLKNDISIGSFERVPHPHFSTLQGDITETNEEFTRYNEWFLCNNDLRCHGWLHLPTGYNHDNDPGIIVIMSHGFGGQKDMGLEKSARKFISMGGFAVLTFDYRNFGESDGEPRNLVSPTDHVEDIHSAIGHIRSKFPESKIAIWGTSLGGGHVIQVAGEYKEKHGDDALIGVISQVGHLDGFSATVRNIQRRGFYAVSKLTVAGLLDVVLSMFGFGPVLIPIFSINDEKVSVMSVSEKEYELYFAKHPVIYLGGWKNLTPARIALKMRKYNPIKVVGDIEAPVLYITAENDVLCPHYYAEKAYGISKVNNPNSQLYMVEGIDHFQVYSEDTVELTSNLIVDFLKKQL